MSALWELVLGVAGAEIGLWRGHARRRAGLYAALALFAAAALLVALALAIAALAVWIGPLAALGVALGAALVACAVVAILLAVEQRRHARRMALQAQVRRRLVRIAALTLAPRVATAPGLLVGLGVLAAALYALGPEKADQPTSPET